MWNLSKDQQITAVCGLIFESNYLDKSLLPLETNYAHKRETKSSLIDFKFIPIHNTSVHETCIVHLALMESFSYKIITIDLSFPLLT